MARRKSAITTKSRNPAKPPDAAPRCGLCGKQGNLRKTECCNNWVCDDEASYVAFSYARNSCDRNHRRFTLCGSHHTEEHPGTWQECAACRGGFETEMYVHFGTNEYNFKKLANLPSFEPKRCGACGAVINLGTDGYSQRGGQYWCESCSAKAMREMLSRLPSAEPGNESKPPASRVTGGAKTRPGRKPKH